MNVLFMISNYIFSSESIIVLISEKFLVSIPDVCVITSRLGEKVVEGVASHGTSHIEKLVDSNRLKPRKRGQKVVEGDAPDEEMVQSTLRKLQGSAPSGGCETVHNSVPKREAVVQALLLHSRPSPKTVLQAEEEPKESDVSYKVWSGRVLKMMDGRPHGMSQAQLEGLYEEQYKQNLPKDWANVLWKTGVVRLDTSKGHIMLTARAKTSQNGLGQVLNGQAKKRIIPSIEQPKTEWDVVITAVETSNEVWVSPRSSLDTKKQLETKLLDYHLSLSSASFTGSKMPPGNYFSAAVGLDQVRRVKVVNLDRIKHTANCRLIDYGSQAVLPWHCLVPLPQEFWSTQAQALKVQLFGFSQYQDVKVVEFVEKKLEGKRVLGKEVAASSSSADIPLISISEADPVRDLKLIENVIQEMNAINLGAVASVSQGRKDEEIAENNNDINDNEGRDSVEPQVLPSAGKIFHCRVSHLVDHSEVYIWLLNRLPYDNLIYLKMHNQILDFYSRKNGGTAVNPVPGDHSTSCPCVLSYFSRHGGGDQGRRGLV